MKKLGVVNNLSYKGDILVKASFAPRMGEGVLDAAKRPLGRVIRVFGPARSPYVTVEPLDEPPLGLIGSDVYVEVET
ncbi:MAG: H/ACA ribonucleoprotein complex subunit GAR1 [Thermoplasmata archaeon]